MSRAENWCFETGVISGCDEVSPPFEFFLRSAFQPVSSTAPDHQRKVLEWNQEGIKVAYFMRQAYIKIKLNFHSKVLLVYDRQLLFYQHSHHEVVLRPTLPHCLCSCPERQHRHPHPRADITSRLKYHRSSRQAQHTHGLD